MSADSLKRSVFRSDALAGVLIMIVAAVFFYGAWKLRAGTLDRMGPGYAPIAMAIFLFVLGGFPVIIILCCIGGYSIESSSTDLVVLSLFAAIGVVFMAFGFQPIPLLLGFILGPLAEENLRRAMVIANGDPLVFVQRPVSLVLVVVIAVLLLLLVLPAFRKKREEFGD